jgi:hypothetical protein
LVYDDDVSSAAEALLTLLAPCRADPDPELAELRDNPEDPEDVTKAITSGRHGGWQPGVIASRSAK